MIKKKLNNYHLEVSGNIFAIGKIIPRNGMRKFSISIFFCKPFLKINWINKLYSTFEVSVQFGYWIRKLNSVKSILRKEHGCRAWKACRIMHLKGAIAQIPFIYKIWQNITSSGKANDASKMEYSKPFLSKYDYLPLESTFSIVTKYVDCEWKSACEWMYLLDIHLWPKWNDQKYRQARRRSRIEN